MMLRCLHLSDFHLKDEKDKVNEFNQNHVVKSMIEYIKTLTAGGLAFDLVIITGDLAHGGRKEQYAVAGKMCTDLLAAVSLKNSRLFVVPGNHDVDRDKIDKRDLKREYPFDSQNEITETLTYERFFPILMEKFEAFNQFAETVMGKKRLDQKRFHYTETLKIKNKDGECAVNLLGLNSALFAGYDGDDEQRKLALGIFQVEAALERADQTADLSLAFFHHPFSCFHKCDRESRNRLTANVDLILTGHAHEPENVSWKDASGNVARIGAGACFEKRESHNSFNILELDLKEGKGRVQFYGYVSDHCKWVIDNRANPLATDGVFEFDIRPQKKPDELVSQAVPTDPLGPGHENKTSLQQEIIDYLEKTAAFHATLPLAGFKTNIRVPIPIEDIYVPLRAMVHLGALGPACFGDAEDAECKLAGLGCNDELSLVRAFPVAGKLNRRGIVILGDPGSGKTTHLKRILLYCKREGPDMLGLPGNMTPVFLPLRELKDLNSGLDAFIQDQLSGPHLQAAPDFGKRLLKAGNLLFLLDGLDEVSDPDQRARVSRWIEEALKYDYQNCFFVITCRFAGYTEDVRLDEHFLEMHVRPLSKEQAQSFIRNWYRIVEAGHSLDEDQARIIADQRIEDLIGRLDDPDFRARRVFEMTRNPLLLANLCLVHRDRGELPRTRAKLYEECTDVLLERWRRGIHLETRVTADSGKRVLQPAAWWMHQKKGRTRASAAELAPVIEGALKTVGWKHGTAPDFLRIVKDESGLLTGWGDGTYGFMHLGFQEYLAALEVRNLAYTDQNVLAELARDFGDPWRQEVILLLLALEQPSHFIGFMRQAARQETFSENTRLIEMCLDEAAEKSPEPFLELLQQKPVKNEAVWKNQHTALRVLERTWPENVAGLMNDPAFMEELKKHPYEKIQQWVRDNLQEAVQEVIRPEPSGCELVWIPGGEFMMGSPKTEGGRYDDEGPLHKVAIDGFYMGRYPVTNKEYGRFLESDPKAEQPKYWADREYNQPNQPVVGVSWEDAKKFASWAGLSLPSEAQWEYACRAGTTTRYYLGDEENHLDRAGWYDKNSGKKLHPVGEKEPNGFGLYDMHGNVWEWCEDDWHSNYGGAPGDGSAWVDDKRGSGRVLRGGSWDLVARHCRSAYRVRDDPALRFANRGFRLVLLPGQR